MPIQLKSREYHVDDADLSQSKFYNANLPNAVFDEVNLQSPSFDNVALTDARLRNVCLTNVWISEAKLDGMTIDGILVTELIAAYRKLTAQRIFCVGTVC